MSKTEKYDVGNNLTLPVNSGTVSGNPVIVGMLVGVAITSRDSAGNASVKVGQGVTTQSVTTTGDVAIGARIFITSATYALTDAAGAGKQLYGHAVSASTGSGTKTLDIRVAPYAVNGTAATPA